jgi:glycosyltransferase involved in cell wall biosynthesis
MPDLSIVIPFHNETKNLPEMFKRLTPVLAGLGLSHEILCIDDGSTDETFAALKRERANNPSIRLVRMARNFGKEAALTCGLHMASGNAAVTLDGDLQHPPEVIKDLVAKWKSGGEMIFAVRSNRNTDGFLRKLFSRAFYAVFGAIADIKMPQGAGDFCLLDRKVIDAVNALPERNRFMKGLVSWVGFKRDTVTFNVAVRPSGKSNWNFFRLMRFAFDGLTAFSTLPLRIWTWGGAVVSLAAIGYGLYLIWSTMAYGIDVPGYASVMVGILFLGGLQLLSLGMIGEYLARVFTEVKARPIYFVAEYVGFGDDART